MKGFVSFFFIFFLLSCNSKKEEIYSNLDGVNHKEIFDGQENGKKHVLNLIYEKDTIPSPIFFDEILLMLEENQRSWRSLAFQAIGYYCKHLEPEQESKLKTSLFNYFLHYPKEYMDGISKMDLIKSDCFLSLFSNYVQYYIQNGEITIISMKNVAFKYCDDCSDSDVLSIYQYLELASKY